MDQQENPAQINQRFESDTAKVVRRHLEDPNHVISEEEMANIRVGYTPPTDELSEQAMNDLDDRIGDRRTFDDSNIAPGAQKSTPWDVVE